jgi:hypothetical protein
MTWYDRLTTATWLDGAGNMIPVGSMTPREARNALTFLERHEQGVVVAATKALTLGLGGDEEEAVIMADPGTWLAATPLVRALTARATAYVERGRTRHLTLV